MNDFNDILRNKLENFREEPSLEVFNNVRSNYPKRSLSDFFIDNKYYFISAASVLIITTVILLLTLPVNKDNSRNIPTQKSDIVTVNKTSNTITTIENKTNNTENKTNNTIITLNDNPPLVDRSELIEFVGLDVFKFTDTLICGSVFETSVKGNENNIVLPREIKMISLNGRCRFICNTPGDYKLVYVEQTGNKIFTDSISLSYRNSSNAEVSVSNQTLCPGDELVLNIKGTKADPEWITEDLNIRKSSNGSYVLDGFRPGKNNVSFRLSTGECRTEYVKEINVIEVFKYSYVSSPNICSGTNASLTISNKNFSPESYILNNEIVSKDGRFNNLTSGIYTLKVNYGSGCQLFDTLLIRDSLTLSPFFGSERDLVNKNKYYFTNLTNVDDYGYESNTNLEFIWKVNGEELSHVDNPVYEFTKEGDNVVELYAILSESCQSVYSETIHISGTNFRIPNIFSPNGDGIGDDYKVIYDGDLLHYNISIINKLGEIVFEGNDIDKSWDGKISGNNDAAEGLYYYIIRGEDKFGNNIEQKGSLQLVRQ
jgi:gliding motility-associated-like protein